MLHKIASCLTLLAGISCLPVDTRAEEPLPRVVILATGGTIASIYDKAKGGLVHALTGAELVEAIPDVQVRIW